MKWQDDKVFVEFSNKYWAGSTNDGSMESYYDCWQAACAYKEARETTGNVSDDDIMIAAKDYKKSLVTEGPETMSHLDFYNGAKWLRDNLPPLREKVIVLPERRSETGTLKEFFQAVPWNNCLDAFRALNGIKDGGE